MAWTVLFQDDFAAEFATFDAEVQDALLALAGHLVKFGPMARRPQVDTLKGSKIANLKELRFEAAGGVWRAAFAFDVKRRAVVLAAANKAGTGANAFYLRLIKLAEKRWAKYLAALEEMEGKASK